jgi:lysophospholipase L1-like esterase
MNLICFGDSNGYAFEKFLVERGIRIERRSVPGTQMRQIFWSILRAWRLHPHTVIFDGGGNDLQAGTPLRKTLFYFRLSCWAIKLLQPQKVIFLGIVPIDNDKGKHAILGPDEVTFTNCHLREVCKEFRYIFIDVFNALRDDSGEMADEHSLDGLHIGDDGMGDILALVYAHYREGRVRWRL